MSGAPFTDQAKWKTATGEVVVHESVCARLERQNAKLREACVGFVEYHDSEDETEAQMLDRYDRALSLARAALAETSAPI